MAFNEQAPNEQSTTVLDSIEPTDQGTATHHPQRLAESYYIRNSGALPRISDSATDYGLASLPTPIDPGRDTVVRRLAELIRINRPYLRPSR